MRRILLLVILGVFATSLLFAGQPPALIKISIQGWKSMEGGITVNPVTHKVYVIAEQATEGADNQKAVFVLDNYVVNTKSAPKKLKLSLPTAQPVKVIPIPNENEYITVDSARNLVYVGTKFSVEQDPTETEPDSDEGEEGAPGGAEPPELGPVTSLEPVPVTVGTLTVIDGNTDTVIATYYFDVGIEPEGVAVDPATGIVYLGAKAPEGEAADNSTCNSGIPIPDITEPGEVECWTAGTVFAFFVDPAEPDPKSRIKLLKEIPAGDDPESVVFADGMVYAANEDDGTVTIATAVTLEGTGGELLTDPPEPRAFYDDPPYYSLRAFSGPNYLACLENQYEADKMAAGGGSVYLTDDRSRVAKITGTAVVAVMDVPGATVCEQIPNSDGGGLNTANNIAFMQRFDGKKAGSQSLYVVSEQDTVTIFDPETMTIKGTIKVPGALHLDGIATDAAANRVWLTDELVQAVFVLQGACANGTGACNP